MENSEEDIDPGRSISESLEILQPAPRQYLILYLLPTITH
jgi:hypothetical protein